LLQIERVAWMVLVWTRPLLTRKLVMSYGDSPLAAESPWSRKLSAAGRAVAMGDG
jgi:hypothetical protein